MKRSEMELKDLAVGDWVKSVGSYDGIYAKVTTIEPNRIGLITNGGNPHHVTEGQLEPIFLTEEILRNNGFYERNGVWFYEFGTYKIYVVITDKYAVDVRNVVSLKDSRGRHDIVTFCRDWCDHFYVHEFQHALRLCNINKTIEL